jgi:hypothetical protein
MARLHLTLTNEDASLLEDALSYYLSASVDNWGSGYPRYPTPEEREDRRNRERIVKIQSRLTGLLEKVNE